MAFDVENEPRTKTRANTNNRQFKTVNQYETSYPNGRNEDQQKAHNDRSMKTLIE